MRKNKKTLDVTHPQLAKEWHPTKNTDLKPIDVAYGSDKKVWWKCEKGHEWEANVYNRAKKGNGCPYCSNRKVLIGYNDLTTTHPEVAKQWHVTKNGDLKPTDVTYGSDKKVWWKCEKGHEWEANVYNRAKKGNGCPSCSSGTQSSFPELTIYYYIKKIFKDTLYREKTILKNEVDIFIPSLNLGIEYDGYYWHKDKISQDTKKSREICKDIKLLRLREIGLIEINVENCINYMVEDNKSSLHDAVNWIFKFIRNNYSIPQQILTDIDNLKIDIDKDEIKIANLVEYIKKKNSLAITHPNIAKQWSVTKNGKLTPFHFSSGSGKKVWWQCEKGHEWKAVISSRVKGSDCPYCSGLLPIEGETDLATTHPELVKEWHPTKNENLKPTDVACGSSKRVWWQCKKGHEWKTKISHRAKEDGSKCPYCLGKLAIKGETDLATTHPQLAKEWNYDKNNSRPTEITYGAGTKVWWICSMGHEWEESPNSRTSKSNSNPKKCPYCSNRKALKGFNDLATTHPEIAKQWHPTKNGNLNPSDFKSGSHKKVWWQCEHSHEWEAIIRDRVRRNKSSCPCHKHNK